MKKEMLKSKNFFFNFFFHLFIFYYYYYLHLFAASSSFSKFKKKQNKTNKTGSVLYNMWDALVCTIFGRRHLKKKKFTCVALWLFTFFFFFSWLYLVKPQIAGLQGVSPSSISFRLGYSVRPQYDRTQKIDWARVFDYFLILKGRGLHYFTVASYTRHSQFFFFFFFLRTHQPFFKKRKWRGQIIFFWRLNIRISRGAAAEWRCCSRALCDQLVYGLNNI